MENIIPIVTSQGQRLDIYSSLLADGIIFVNAPIDQSNAGRIVSCLLCLTSDGNKGREAKIYVNSRFGDLLSAMSVVDIIEFYKNRGTRIQTFGLGEIGAASCLLLAAGSKGYRKAAAHCQISLLPEKETAPALTREAIDRRMQTTQGILIQLLAKYSDQPEDLFRIRANDAGYFEAEEAKRLGLIDEIA